MRLRLAHVPESLQPRSLPAVRLNGRKARSGEGKRKEDRAFYCNSQIHNSPSHGRFGATSLRLSIIIISIRRPCALLRPCPLVKPRFLPFPLAPRGELMLRTPVPTNRYAPLQLVRTFCSPRSPSGTPPEVRPRLHSCFRCHGAHRSRWRGIRAQKGSTLIQHQDLPHRQRAKSFIQQQHLLHR